MMNTKFSWEITCLTQNLLQLNSANEAQFCCNFHDCWSQPKSTLFINGLKACDSWCFHFFLQTCNVFCFGCALPGLSSHSSRWMESPVFGPAGYCTDVAEFKISPSVSRCVTLVSILSLSSDYDNAIAPDHSSCKGLWKTWLTHFMCDLLVSKSCFRHRANSKQFQEDREAKTTLALIYLRNYYLIHTTVQKLYWVFF